MQRGIIIDSPYPEATETPRTCLAVGVEASDFEVALEVLFQPLYRAQPTFWDIADHLRPLGYALQGIHEQRHHAANHAILRWADAVFVAPELVALS